MENLQPLTGFPTYNLPPTKAYITKGSQTPDPDRAIRIQHAQAYPLQVWYFLACLIFLVSIVNWTGLGLKYYRARVQRKRLSRTSGEASSQLRTSVSLLRLPGALGDTFRVLSFRWTIPIGQTYRLNFADVLLTAMYIIVCFTCALVNTTSTKGVKFDPHYYANIAGHIVALQFPLIVALGMKNNIISFLTGVSFDKLLYLHGIVSRVVVVLICLHATGRVNQLNDRLVGVTAITVPVIQAGVVAGVSLALLSIVSIRPIRRKAYEFFLIVHFFLAFTAVLSAYFHAESLDYGHFVWPAFLLWGLDRLIRVLRIATHSIMKKSSGPVSTTEAKTNPPTEVITNPKLELLSSQFVQLTIPKPRFFHWRPGQCAYLTFPGVSASPLEAHPFTISTIDDGSENSHLKFFIRVQKGATKRLFNSAEGSGEVRVLLDGPYSSPPLLIGYDTVLLIAGGSGVAFTLPLFLDLIKRSKQRGPMCRRLTFVWTIRNMDHLTWIQSELLEVLQDLPSHLTLSIHIFITGAADAAAQGDVEEDLEALDDDTASNSEAHKSDNEDTTEGQNEKAIGSSNINKTTKDLLVLPMVKIHQGRADLDKLIRDEVMLAKDTMSVNVCGIHGLTGAVRKAMQYPRMLDILKGGPTISLHVEAFGGNTPSLVQVDLVP
ncbi:hypothetical protein P691DRAFT_807110 [Macrolepiota fuliginosa MF-IS2]|uniref:ferric-chelate reductase (NADPH) n=1 Tax=Macrolepiota fuliginosa MF-IS2 TaxID=1400762 RepID=A0A9P5X4F0_9AGAR|nr:hypothetical protein P691DRAFT_807110 [Macrolepiota fuliginosa MF-IS2]